MNIFDKWAAMDQGFSDLHEARDPLSIEDAVRRIDSCADYLFDTTFTGGVIYEDKPPRPSWWRHPVKWWKWEPPRLIATVDLDAVAHEQDGVTIYFGGESGGGMGS